MGSVHKGKEANAMRASGKNNEGKALLERILEHALPAESALTETILNQIRYSASNDIQAPDEAGVYFIISGDSIVYAGSAGHGKDPKTGGLHTRIYRQLRRTGLSAVRQGIAEELGHPDYRPQNNAEKMSVLESSIDARIKRMSYTYLPTDTAKSATRLEHLAIAFLNPKYNRG
jgi:hypothetical protein